MAQLVAWWHWLLASTAQLVAQLTAWWPRLLTGVAQLVAQLIAWWPLLAGVGVAAALYVAWWLWWRLPKRQARRLNLPDDKTRADVEDNFRKTISQIFGGAAVLAGAAFAYWQFTDQRQTSQQQLQASHDLLISNQVSKGFEQLGSDKVTIRLGGIYALEGVMNTSEQYHQPVLEALCAFVRDSKTNKTGDDPPTADVQAALTVIGRRSEGEGVIDLHGAHIPKADLTRADLTRAHLSGADLGNSRLFDATLGRADLTDANLTDADLTDANLGGANLHGANLSRAHLAPAYLGGADLSGAKGLTQEQLDKACGESVKGIDPPLAFHPKPCF